MVPTMVHHTHTWAQHHQPAYLGDGTRPTSPKALSADSTTPVHQQLACPACLHSMMVHLSNKRLDSKNTLWFTVPVGTAVFLLLCRDMLLRLWSPQLPPLLVLEHLSVAVSLAPSMDLQTPQQRSHSHSLKLIPDLRHALAARKQRLRQHLPLMLLLLQQIPAQLLHLVCLVSMVWKVLMGELVGKTLRGVMEQAALSSVLWE